MSKLLPVDELWVKRDDLSGFATSGNKVRKLDFLLADALRLGAVTVVTAGGWQSNHCRATAAACAQVGLRCRILLARAPSTPPQLSGNLFLDRFFGAEVHIRDLSGIEAMNRAINDEVALLREEGVSAYAIPVGGSNAIGARGYVRAAAELAHSSPAPGSRERGSTRPSDPAAPSPDSP
ncbi:MAG TPA: pyridoxal-phosphate dependent enzyme, partial [Bacteroidetes bacterium]|nr:pyridoxal-phosphate dependent enzyme [Bacteroidota bacterium]